MHKMDGQSCCAVAFDLYISRREKFGKTKNSWFRWENWCPCPEIVMKCNRLMKGVWQEVPQNIYLRLFCDFMDIATNNVCIVYNKILKITNCKSKEVSNLDFRQKVAIRLIGSYSNRSRTVASSVKKSKKFNVIPASLSTHKMKRGSAHRRCQLCSNKK